MPLDPETQTKKQLIAEIERLSEDYPALADLDTNVAKATLVEAAQAVIAAAAPSTRLIGAKPTGAEYIADLLKTHPEACVLPTAQPVLRLAHPKLIGHTFTLTALPVQETSVRMAASPNRRLLKGEASPAMEVDVMLTPLASLPQWTHTALAGLIQARHVALYPHPGAYQTPVSHGRLLVDYPVGDVGMKTRKEGQAMVLEPTGDFDRVEQRVAWAVINVPVGGEPPLPENVDEISDDPKRITVAEAQHVEARIRRAIQTPSSFVREARAFDPDGLRVFLNQLVALEMKGFTPRRDTANQIGGTRPAILVVLRQIAAEHGFDVVGSYVRDKVGTPVRQDLLPSVPLPGVSPAFDTL